jgi:hypothetical protein
VTVIIDELKKKALWPALWHSSTASNILTEMGVRSIVVLPLRFGPATAPDWCAAAAATTATATTFLSHFFKKFFVRSRCDGRYFCQGEVEPIAALSDQNEASLFRLSYKAKSS